jgi:hypothetical protein
MSTLSQFSGGAATRSVVNLWSAGGASSTSVGAGSANGAREVLSGALTANTLKTLVSISTGGQISYLSAYSANATSRTIRLVVICDGVTVFDATSNAIAASGTGMRAAGSGTAPTGVIRFNASCVIQVASSLTETDSVAVAYVLT